MSRTMVVVAVTLLFSVAVWAQSTDSQTQSTSTTQSTTQSTTSATPSTTGQSGSSSDQSSQSGASSGAVGSQTVTGCLSGSAGTFALTEGKSGTTYMLAGDDAELGKHVGHEISVTGTAVNPNENRSSQTGAASSSGTGSDSGTHDTRPHHIRVSSVREVADHCRNNVPNTK